MTAGFKLKTNSLVICFTILSCSSPIEPCYINYGFRNYTNYIISPTSYTNAGIQIDDPEHQLDLQKIDYIVNSVTQCVKEATTNRTAEELAENECISTAVDAEVKQCLVIKVSPDWHVSSCTGEQIFSCDVGNLRCEQKGQTATNQCPCSCRATIQDSNTIIVTPNLKLLPAHIITMQTGCLNPWSGRLLKCATPQ